MLEKIIASLCVCVCTRARRVKPVSAYLCNLNSQSKCRKYVAHVIVPGKSRELNWTSYCYIFFANLATVKCKQSMFMVNFSLAQSILRIIYITKKIISTIKKSYIIRKKKKRASFLRLRFSVPYIKELRCFLWIEFTKLRRNKTAWKTKRCFFYQFEMIRIEECAMSQTI